MLMGSTEIGALRDLGCQLIGEQGPPDIAGCARATKGCGLLGKHGFNKILQHKLLKALIGFCSSIRLVEHH